MRDGWKGIVSVSAAAHERLSDRPGFVPPAFQSCFPQEVILMHLVLKVVSLFGTIVLKLRWSKSGR
jgi:hypothetical protein